MMNLANDLLVKLETAGIEIKAVCRRADVSPSTITLMRRTGSCSQRIYDKMLVALIEMCRERQQQMAEVGLVV